jgi:hypothetical protein
MPHCLSASHQSGIEPPEGNRAANFFYRPGKNFPRYPAAAFVIDNWLKKPWFIRLKVPAGFLGTFTYKIFCLNRYFCLYTWWFFLVNLH